ncbi:MAG: hypothetical protein LM571_05725 [Desulfurococcaceae archaeon]|nr:hypothetical protein [Desulfurococcaceae archaeon]
MLTGVLGTSGASVEEAVRLLRRLVENYGDFFDSSGYLNSEGRKVLEVALRGLLREVSWVRGYVQRVRRRGTYEEVRRLLEVLESSNLTAR